jgi:nucleotide-binding universal stress UspA family protein
MAEAKTKDQGRNQAPRLDKIKKILFPTDFSEAAHNAFQYTLEFAEAFGADVHLMHVYTMAPMPTDFVPQSFIDALEAEKIEKATTFVKSYEEEAQQNFKTRVSVSHSIVKGYAEDEIIGMCREHNFDLVVMGTQGAASQYGKAFGSVSVKVMKDTPCPVLVVPSEARFKPPKRLLYAVSFEPRDFEIIDQLINFSLRFDATLYCGHIRNQGQDWDRIDPELFQRLGELEKTDLLEFFMINGEDVVQALQKFIDDYRIDIVTMLTHKRYLSDPSFQESMTKQMALSTDVPLLVFHEKK